MTHDHDLFDAVDRYIDTLYVPHDDVLRFALATAREAGLPDIQVSAGQGKFLYLLAKLTNARRILEIGTLGGYSTIWLARGLPADGRLITLEYEETHAAVARTCIERAGLASQAEVNVGSAIDTLPEVIATNAPFDLVFIDADKVSYSLYYREVMKGVHSGSLILADNVIRGGKVLDPKHPDPNAQAARAFNALIAGDDRVEVIVLQQIGLKGHDGLAVMRVK